jgi:predicted Rossmann-fold nucleotide-binding protein
MAGRIAKVISGGQTGVDIAALRAAKALGIPTGGTMPKGWRTLAGPRPEYRDLYGMVEHMSESYAPRTYANAAAADVTIRIAANFGSAGEICTAKAIARAGTVSADISVYNFCSVRDADIAAAVRLVQELAGLTGRPVVINFAGNSERTAPGIERLSEGVVRRILEALR